MGCISSFSFLLALSLLLQPEVSKATRITSEELANLSYEQIHKLAIEQQIAEFPDSKPIKSLHTRQNQLLDGIWNFCLDPEGKGFDEKWFSKELNERTCGSGELFYQMPVPSAFNEVPSEGRVRGYIGWVWYQKVFYLEPELGGNKLKLLHFDNVNYLAAVWINKVGGKPPPNEDNNYRFLGMHVGGFLPFQFKLNKTDRKFYTKTSEPFRLTLAVSNRLTQDTIPSGSMVDYSEQVGHKFEKFQPDFDFFHFAGIMGSVRLVYLPEVHLNRLEVREAGFGLTETSKQKFVKWIGKVCLKNRRLLEQRNASFVHLERRVYEELDGLNDGYEVSIIPVANLTTDCHLFEVKTLDNLERMSNENCSYSYSRKNHFNPTKTLRVQLSVISGSPDEHLLWVDVFELKLNQMSENRRNFLRLLDSGNSSDFRFRLQGFGLHQEQLFAGRALSGASLFKDIYLLKQMGANVIRTSHYPYSEAFLDACDKADLLVIAECQAVGLRSFSKLKLMLHKQLLLEMMERDHQHSSIIAWSLANEPQSQLNESKPYFEELSEYARKELAKFTIKSNRPLTAALAQSHQDDLVGHTLDFLMINRYFGWYDYSGVLEAIKKPLLESLRGWSKKYPKARGLLVSEFGAGALAGLHRQLPGQLYSEEFQMELLLEYERIFDSLNNQTSNETVNFLGSMIWSLADFSTHDSLSRIGGTNRKGLFTFDRQPKIAVEPVRRLYWAREANFSVVCGRNSSH